MSTTSRKNVRWEDKDKRSGSSRASTTGGSSSGSSYSEYSDHRYNIAALEETLRTTVNELDQWKNKAAEAEQQIRKYQKETKEYKSRVSALDQRVETLEDDKSELEKSNKALRDEIKDLKDKYAKLQKKVNKSEAKTDSPSSPDTGKPRRHESNSSKESDSDRHNDRLKARFNRSPESTTSDSSSSKPPSSSRATRGSRRLSINERQPYLEEWGPGGSTAATQTTAPVSPSSRRTGNYIATNYPPIATGPIPSPTTATTPRSHRPTVEYTTYANVPVYPEDGNYHPYPLPPPEMRKR
ncbi:hypothetical protein M406DRAFT_356330 [Cryphonectria parasitica EP155]|uniref:Uncharacterized protein n=1 Tax=Cryphonectria parasitica (strain ATCC 38755 / EP155) TaxID=660469 RepID=A0A9P4Y4J9_CRYP1|nr:uncharacterized protein M406DRAFT_356330 [Cryphonectria parasitica EP155]KAF3766406.1 hypothetical protein M406DRAFT_356330 [Cryphonectria parasitica EP155]